VSPSTAIDSPNQSLVAPDGCSTCTGVDRCAEASEHAKAMATATTVLKMLMSLSCEDEPPF
jgi:hypothetical protein